MDFSPFVGVRSNSILHLGLSISIHGMTIIWEGKGRRGGKGDLEKKIGEMWER